MKHQLKIIVILFLITIHFTAYSAARAMAEKTTPTTPITPIEQTEPTEPAEPTEPTEKEVIEKFRQAKKFIYSKEWEKAAAVFEEIATAFPENKYTDDSLYWLGYSLNKMSRDLKNVEKSLEIRKKALKNLAHLIVRYPVGKWRDDASRLTVEIAGELVASGLKGFDKVVLNGVKDSREAETKILALIQLFDMDREKAFSIAEKILRTDKNTELRQKAIFALGQRGDPRAISILVEVAEKDTDKQVREKAVFWLGQMGTPDSFKHLLKLYKTTTDIELKKVILVAMSDSGHKDAVKELIRIYKKEKNQKLKEQIIFALGNSKSKEAKEFILEILK